MRNALAAHLSRICNSLRTIGRILGVTHNLRIMPVASPLALGTLALAKPRSPARLAPFSGAGLCGGEGGVDLADTPPENGAPNRQKGQRKATSFDIAYLAGVSQPTVSRALRGSSSVSEATRERILKIAAELNYAVDHNASSLRSQKTNRIAVLFFEDETSDSSFINPFFVAMLGSITRAAARARYDVLISFQSLSDNWHLAWEDSRKADGLILLGYGDYENYRPRLERMVEQGSHFVRWGSPEIDHIGHTIGSDNRLGGRLAGEALLAKGRRRLAFLGDASDHYPEFHDRYLGLKEVAGDALVAQEDALTLERHGYDAAARLFARVPDVDGVFAGSDLIAIGALQYLKESGRRVPEDVSVIGFDDISAAQHAIPPLTTIRQDSRAAGRQLVAQLLGMIEGEAPGEQLLSVELVERSSA